MWLPKSAPVLRDSARHKPLPMSPSLARPSSDEEIDGAFGLTSYLAFLCVNKVGAGLAPARGPCLHIFAVDMGFGTGASPAPTGMHILASQNKSCRSCGLAYAK